MSELTVAAIATTQPGDILKDGTVAGLHLRAFPKAKAFYLYYRTRGGRQRRPKLGDYPQMTITNARQSAKAILARVAAGEDPGADWQNERQDGMTLNHLADEYMERHAERWKKTAGNDLKIINTHIRPRKIGAMRLSDISDDDIERLHAAVSKTAPYQANRLLSLLSKMFNLAEKWKHIPRGTNPCFGVRRNREAKRERYLTPDEGPKIAAALDDESPLVGATLLLIMFTGARRSEIAGRSLHIEDGVIVLVEHKTDTKGEARRIMVPEKLLALVTERKLEGKTLPDPVYVSKRWRQVCKRAGVTNLRLHDLRHTYASVGLSNGVPKDWLMPLLGHSSMATTSRYSHLMTDQRRQAVETVAENLESLLGRG